MSSTRGNLHALIILMYCFFFVKQIVAVLTALVLLDDDISTIPILLLGRDVETSCAL